MNKNTHGATYSALGAIIAEGRKSAGLQQIDLASALGTTQQSVSRWEAGVSRPRPHQFLKLAKAIRVSESNLREAAGYGITSQIPPHATAGSLDHPLPIDALSPESFERFVDHLLRHLYADAREIRRAGKSGHAQGGIDLLIVLPDGQRHTFQCKRVARFGPADVAKVVADHTEQAECKHLVLSRVASPQAAEAMRQFEDWVLWDKEDISRLVRTRLPTVDQVRIVDMFFPGQRLTLLGVPSAGAWQTPEEFFAPFAEKHATFRHDWPLVGLDRTANVERVLSELNSEASRIILVSGRGGVGKSRLLKAVVDRLRASPIGLDPLFLSPTEALSTQALELLGNEPRVLIVDDAHDRSDLPALFAFAAGHNVRVVLASRPYATARLRGQVGALARSDTFTEIELKPLSLSESISLAEGVLREMGGDPALAEPIAQATRDCPLVTVMAARIATTDKLPLELAQNTQAFRDTILGKFAKTITGELAPPGEQNAFRDVLKVVALAQPFGIDDPDFRQLVSTTAGLSNETVSTTLRILSDGGIIFRRGSQYRLMPDLLGDYIIEQSCISPSDYLESFAEKVFATAPRALLGHVLVNLGRLDWRRNGGDPSKSHLLAHLWRALNVADGHHDSALEAASAAAYYQPIQAIEFVTEQARKGLRHDEFSKILKHAAYSFTFLDDACALLWELGRNDRRDLSRCPNHPIRVLTELCKVEPNKSIEFNKKVVSFGLSLLENQDSFISFHTPFSFLKGILSGDGHTTEGDSRTITFKPFVVTYDRVQEPRASVIRAALKLLESDSLSVAAQATKFLRSALHYPMGTFGAAIPSEIREKYTVEFRETLTQLRKLVAKGKLSPVIVIAIVNSVSWHANYADSATSKIAGVIMRSLPKTLEFRTLSALVDGFGRIFLGRFDADTWQTRLNKWVADVVADLAVGYPRAADLRHFLEACLERVAEAELTKDGSSHTLIHEILRKRPDFALELVEYGLQNPTGRLSAYLGMALAFVNRSDAETGRRWSRRFLDTGNSRLHQAVGRGYSDPPLFGGLLVAEDREILIRVLSSSDSSVVRSGLGALSTLARDAPRLSIDLLRHTNFHSDCGLADDVFMHLMINQDEIFQNLDQDDVRFILSRLKPIAELEGYWVETLLSHLSRDFAEQITGFFMDRVEQATASDESFSFIRPINYGPWAQVPLQIKEATAYPDLLERVWSWMCARDGTNWRFEHHAAALFEGLFLPVDESVIAFISSKLAEARKQELRWMAVVFSHTDANFVFDYQTLVESFLDSCDRAGQPARRKGIDALFRSAISGIRSGIPGEPFPRDLDSLERTNSILSRLPRLSAAYELYDLIRRHAQQGIEYQRQEAEFFDG